MEDSESDSVRLVNIRLRLWQESLMHPEEALGEAPEEETPLEEEALENAAKAIEQAKADKKEKKKKKATKR